MTIRSFTDLIAWQEGHKLVVQLYEITNAFPRIEAFGLTSQIRRCAVSITSNIAEGFRRRSKAEKIQFYYMAAASLTGLQNQLLIARDVGYLDKDKFRQLAGQSIKVHKLLNGLIKGISSLNTKF